MEIWKGSILDRKDVKKDTSEHGKYERTSLKMEILKKGNSEKGNLKRDNYEKITTWKMTSLKRKNPKRDDSEKGNLEKDNPKQEKLKGSIVNRSDIAVNTVSKSDITVTKSDTAVNTVQNRIWKWVRRFSYIPGCTRQPISISLYYYIRTLSYNNGYTDIVLYIIYIMYSTSGEAIHIIRFVVLAARWDYYNRYDCQNFNYNLI